MIPLQRRDKGSALGLVLVFVTLLGVWLGATLLLTQVSLNVNAHIYDRIKLDNAVSIRTATSLALLYKNQGCTALPKGYTCSVTVIDTDDDKKCFKDDIFNGNNGKHLGELKRLSTIEEDIYIDSNDDHVHLKIKRTGHCGHFEKEELD